MERASCDTEPQLLGSAIHHRAPVQGSQESVGGEVQPHPSSFGTGLSAAYGVSG